MRDLASGAGGVGGLALGWLGIIDIHIYLFIHIYIFIYLWLHFSVHVLFGAQYGVCHLSSIYLRRGPF